MPNIPMVRPEALRTATPSMLDLVMSRFQHSKSTFNALFTRTSRWYDLYRGVIAGHFQSFRNNVTIPLLLSTVQADVARKVSISFGTWPYVSFFGFGPEDAAKARKNELLISAQMKDSKSMLKGADMFLTGNLYGTAVWQDGWRQETKRLITREAEVGPGGKRFEKLNTEDRIVFDGPDWDVVDILDFFPQPGIRDIQEMGWVIRREFVELDELMRLSKPKSEGGAGMYDRGAVLELKRSALLREVDREMEVRRNFIRSPFSEQETRRLEKFAKPIELLHMWSTAIPSEFLSDGQTPNRVVTVANRMKVIRNHPNPYWHGEIPFGAYSPLRDPHFFHGFGKMEIGESLQLTANRIMNQKLDALDLFIDPVFAYDRNKGVDTRNLFMRSGKLVATDGNPAEALMPIIPNMSQIQNAYQEVNDLWRWIQQGTGIIEDTVMGGQSGGRSTAREFLGRQENVSTRLLLESRFAEEMWLEPMANRFRALNKQFLSTPKKLRILGADAITNPVTGEPLPPEEIDINLEDLAQDYDVRARGATQTIGKAARQQNLVLLLQAAGSHPAALQLINWVAFFRDMFRTFEMTNVDELMNPPPAQKAALAQAEGAQQPQGASPQAPGDILGALGLPGQEQVGSIEGTLSGR